MKTHGVIINQNPRDEGGVCLLLFTCIYFVGWFVCSEPDKKNNYTELKICTHSTLDHNILFFLFFFRKSNPEGC